MKIPLDHKLDWRISDHLPEHEVRIVLEMAWDTLKNGALLAESEKSGFSVLITSDKGIKAQQTIKGRSVAVVIFRAPNNRLETHVAMFPEVTRVLAGIQPGQIIEVFHPDMKPKYPVTEDLSTSSPITPHKSPSVDQAQDINA